jgi:hypothetical protein
MFTVCTVRGFVCILARPPPPHPKNALGSPFVTPVTSGLFLRYSVPAWRKWQTQ